MDVAKISNLPFFPHTFQNPVGNSSQGIFFAGLNLCEYKGCVVSEEAVTTGLMEKISNLEVQDEDVFVASFPKSGTTWLQQVVYLLYHPDNPDSELMEWKFPYLEHAYPGEKIIHCLLKSPWILF